MPPTPIIRGRTRGEPGPRPQPQPGRRPPARARSWTLPAAASVFGLLLATAGIGGGAPAGVRPAFAAGAGKTAAERTVTVTGTGRVLVKPDVVRLDLAVEGAGETPAAALGGAGEAMARVQRALLARGVRESDLKTSGVWAQPRYDTVDGRQVRRGFTATQTLAATLRDLRTAGATIGAAVDAGGEGARINGASLEVEDVEAPRRAARAAAFADARAAAEQYAAAAGRRLGPVLRIVEAGGEPPPPEALRADAKAAEPVPIQPGTAEVRMTVTAVFTLS